MASHSEATAAAAASAGEPVNFLDIKLHGVYQLPPSWTTDSGPAPVFNDHVFRYEAEISVAGTTHVFRNGRLLQSIPLYTDFVEAAKLPPPVGGSDGISEEPEQPDEVPAAAVPPIRERPPTPAASVVTSAEGQPAAGATSAAASGSGPGSAIFWVLGPEVDVEVKDDYGGKKEAKPAAKKGGAPVPAAAPEVVKPIVPNGQAPPLCVCRVPLTLMQVAMFEDQLEKSTPLSVVFRRVLRAGCPPEWEDQNELRFQATIPVSLKQLAEPGSTFLKVQAPLDPVVPDPPKEEEKGGKGAAKAKVPPKKAKGAAPAVLSEEIDPSEPHPYVANKSFCTVSISCHAAVTRLPQARPRPDLQPSDLIPKRLRPPRRPVEATKQFSREVEGLMWRIVRDFREHKQSLGSSGAAGGGPDAMRQSFLSFLTTSGKLHVYRDLLLPPVQGIVKETFIRKPSPSTEELDRVASELYTYLLDQTHLTMGRALADPRVGGADGAQLMASSTPDGASPVDRWKRLATEAEVMKELAAAARYHQERIVHSRSKTGDESPDVWCDYAEFCLRTRDALKAEQAYREALALDMAHMNALIGYGALLLSRHRFKEAEVLFQSAVDLAGDATSWGCVALYYDALFLSLPDSPEEATHRTSCKRESKYCVGQAVRTASMPNATPADVFRQLAERMVELHQEDLASICLSRVPPSLDVDMLYAKLFLQTNQLDEGLAILKGLAEAHPHLAQVRLLLGDVYAAMNKATEAEAQYDQALRIDATCGTGPALVRLGNMYIALGKFKDALSAFLMAAKAWPCGLTWLGVGICYFRMDDMTRAEQSLNESNILNNLNAKTWSYLALVCLRQRREEEGDQAFNQSIKQGLADPYLICEIGAEQARLNRFKIAEACFRRSLALQDDCNTRMHLGRALASLRRLGEAREEFAHVARTTAHEAQRARAEDQIAMLPAE